MTQRRAVIIGAGPAGLTAAYEMLRQTDVQPLVVERDDIVGGIARTVNYRGNRIDIGGHRFFSKSDRVMEWWMEMMPLEEAAAREMRIAYQGKQRDFTSDRPRADPETEDRVMLLRNRTSRIYFLRKLFSYPVRLDFATLKNLGPVRSVRIGLSYLWRRLRPIREPRNLEEFFIDRFGEELYRTFFKEYTEKVWGKRCSEISADWGAQRIKGLSVAKAIGHFLKQLNPFRREDIAQKDSETSLIERFLYPKHGPGQLWEEVTRRLREDGVEVRMETEAVRLHTEGSRVVGVTVRDKAGAERRLEADYVLSTMPVRTLLDRLDADLPADVRRVGDGLEYRDFITVGLLVDRLQLRDPKDDGKVGVRDNWIYVQEPGVQVGRLQIFNNWSPYLVADEESVWLGLEYFCNEGDALWTKTDDELVELAERELVDIDVLAPGAVRDATVVRMPKTYPSYTGTFADFGVVRDYLDGFENLFLMGRNGMHRYNNQDHSMLTAMLAVEAIRDGSTDKSALWEVNAEEDYHEEKSA